MLLHIREFNHTYQGKHRRKGMPPGHLAPIHYGTHTMTVETVSITPHVKL
jgi:hypothetical protein